MTIFPKSVTRPITEPVIVERHDRHAVGRRAVLDDERAVAGAWMTASVAAGATRAAQAAKMKARRRIALKVSSCCRFPRFRGP